MTTKLTCSECEFSSKKDGDLFCVKNAPGADGYAKADMICAELKPLLENIKNEFGIQRTESCDRCKHYDIGGWNDRDADYCALMVSKKNNVIVKRQYICRYFEKNDYYDRDKIELELREKK
jgi:hypothetical protein